MPIVLAAFFVGLAVLPTSAHAAPAWLSPVHLLADGQSAIDSRVAAAPTGGAIAVWHRDNGSNQIVQAATRAAGGGWSDPQDLSAPGQNADGPQVALDAQGNAVVVWLRNDGTNDVIQAATRAAGGSWSDPQDLSAPGQNADGPQVALDAQGNAVVVWYRSNGSNQIVQAASRPAGDGSAKDGWSDPQDLSAPGQNASDPQVALDAQGNAVAAWKFEAADNTGGVQAATRAAGGRWGSPRELTVDSGPRAGIYALELAVDPQGNAVVVWNRFNGSNYPNLTNYMIVAATRDAGGDWSTPRELSAPDSPNFNPDVAVDAQGKAVAVWEHVYNPSYGGTLRRTVQAASRSAGDGPAKGNWSQPQDISSSLQNADGPQVAVDAQGDAVAVWRRLEGEGDGGTLTSGVVTGQYFVVAASRPAGEDWSAPQDLWSTGPSDGPPVPTADVALDAQGNAVAVWSLSDLHLNTGRLRIPAQAAGYDAAGPQLRDLRIPSGGTVGSPLSFSVSPLDVWSQVASTSWTFGDGKSASGESVSHTYAAPGSYPVSVTSTDSLGNSSTEKRTVTVAAPGGAAPGGGEPILTVPGGGGLPTATPPFTGARDSVALAAALARERARARALGACLVPVARHTRRENRLARSGSARARRLARRHARSHARVLRGRCLKRHGRTPSQVTGLSASALARKEVVLFFRAPGSDGASLPPARSYLVKQSTTPITDLRGFRGAQSLCNGACRFPLTRVGQQVKLRITDLRPRTNYYYAIAARDNVSRRLGPRSQTLRVRTK